jgi:thrombospondin motif-containing protein 16
MPQPPNDDLYILPDEYKPSSRHKRSLLKSHRNEELNVETLVVVDRKMMQSHGHENITTYVLTILNMVGLMFVCVCVCVCAPECVCVCVCV